MRTHTHIHMHRYTNTNLCTSRASRVFPRAYTHMHKHKHMHQLSEQRILSWASRAMVRTSTGMCGSRTETFSYGWPSAVQVTHVRDRACVCVWRLTRRSPVPGTLDPDHTHTPTHTPTHTHMQPSRLGPENGTISWLVRSVRAFHLR